MDNYKDFVEDIREISKNSVIVSGITDIKDGKMLNTEYWIMVGWAEDKDIRETFSYIEDLNEIDGEYEFDIVFKWAPGEYDEYGRSTLRSYLEDKYTKFNLIQTLTQRERQEKIDYFFDCNFG